LPQAAPRSNNLTEGPLAIVRTGKYNCPQNDGNRPEEIEANIWRVQIILGKNMPRFNVPTNANIHATKAFLTGNDFFNAKQDSAILALHPIWMYLEPVALAMVAAWGAWCKRQGYNVEPENLTKAGDYAARMKLFEHLGIAYNPHMVEHEEIGRFLPLRNVVNRQDVTAVIADVSALLHLDHDPESLAAVQHCMSELLRNVLEHSGSPEGAFVCAHNYSDTEPHRVTIAVADCGRGIADHLGHRYPQIRDSDLAALRYAMQPGVTGAMPGVYGTPDNAGAGLFITRGIAKGTGGYFEIISGKAAYRLRRARNPEEQLVLHTDPFDDRSDKWEFEHAWQGTVVTLEVRTDMIAEKDGFFSWIQDHIPDRVSAKRKIRFT
jgi:anti-sigma regulatory factor (Ser/Thr protein kinase)